MNAILSAYGVTDEDGLPPPPPIRVNQAWIVTFSDLVALMLTFFVVLYTISARDPSKSDAAVSSVNDKFAVSRIFSGNGLMAAKSGIVLTEQKYLDDVVTMIRGRSNLGEIKTSLSGNGILTARIARDRLFIPRTGVLSPDGKEFAREIAHVLLEQNSGISLRSMEVRISAPADEIDSATSGNEAEAPVIIRQAGSFVSELTELRVLPSAISVLVTPADTSEVVLLFYSAAPAGEGEKG